MSENTIISALSVAAAFLLAYAFLRRRRWLEATPAEGSRLKEFGENIRLRDLFRLAVLMEEKGRSFYLKMAEKARDPRMKQLCASLAEEETLHLQLLQEKLGAWNPLGVNPLIWPVFLARVKQEGFFEDAPREDSSEDEMAAYAIQQEAKSAEFYQIFEQAFPQAWKREQLHNLVLDERAHEAKLRAAYPHIK